MNSIENQLKGLCDIVTGVIDGVLSVSNGLESWISRISAMQHDTVTLSAQQRALLIEQMEYWASALCESLAKLGHCLQPDSAKRSDSDEDYVMYEYMCIMTVICYIFFLLT